MSEDNSQQVTALLIKWSEGSEPALEKLMPLVYNELHRMARRHMSGQNSGHTFQTTELIHEAYLKLAHNDQQNWNSRAHFFGIASKTMRHILVDYARSKKTNKRGNDPFAVTFEETAVVSNNSTENILALNEALDELNELDERKCHVVEMKYFGGLTTDEIAEVLKVSNKTVKRDWSFARRWLLKELSH